MLNMGYVFAIISSIFIATYVVPRKFTKNDPIHFGLMMGFGFFISSTILYLIEVFLFQVNQTVFDPLLILSALSGVIWAFSLICLVKAIDRIGLAKSNQWKNLQGPIAAFLNLVILSEYLSTNSLLVLFAAVFIFLSAVQFTISESIHKMIHTKKGVVFALSSAVGFSLTVVLNKFVTVNSGVYAQQVVMSFFIFLSILTYILIKKEVSILPLERKSSLLSILSGVIYLGASFFMLESFKYIPASIGFSIIQLNGIWVLLLGIFVFKEIRLRKNLLRIILGFIFAIIGLVFLIV
jgi:glucose uptake protein GlcU